MKTENLHKLPTNALELEVVELLDFKDYPILIVEKDIVGTLYLSYLAWEEELIERRVIIPISQARLNEILAGTIIVKQAFDKPESNSVYVCDFNKYDGKLLETFLVPSENFIKMNPVPSSYKLLYEPKLNKPTLDSSGLLANAINKNKVLIDLYLQGPNLINSVKPYAFYKIMTPVVEILKSLLDFDDKSVDKYMAFSNIRQSSLGVTIEVNRSNDMFLSFETLEVPKLMELFACDSKEKFEIFISKTNNEKYLAQYSKIIKAIITNNATLWSAYANPIDRKVLSATISPDKASRVAKIIDETFDEIVDIEEVEGTLEEIDIAVQRPTFKIFASEEQVIIKGFLDSSLLEIIKADKINLGKEKYRFTLRTTYHPKTISKAEKTERILTLYKQI